MVAITAWLSPFQCPLSPELSDWSSWSLVLIVSLSFHSLHWLISLLGPSLFYCVSLKWASQMFRFFYKLKVIPSTCKKAIWFIAILTLLRWTGDDPARPLRCAHVINERSGRDKVKQAHSGSESLETFITSIRRCTSSHLPWKQKLSRWVCFLLLV